MVIQTCSEVFAVLMHLDAPHSLSAETIKVMPEGLSHKFGYSQNVITEAAANDRTALTHQKP